MYILQIINSIEKKDGGTSKSISYLYEFLNKEDNFATDIITLNAVDSFIVNNNKKIYKLTKINLLLSIFNRKKYKKYQIIHAHGVWDFTTFFSFIISFMYGNSLIISTRGMLEPWSLSQKRFKKFIYFNLILKPILNYCKAIHATSLEEKENLIKLSIKSKIVIIKNGLDIPKSNRTFNESIHKKKIILFVSRLHKKKGIEILIESMNLLDENIKSNSLLYIIGNGEKEYVDLLNKLLIKMNLNKSVIILGPKYSNELEYYFLNSDLFILPSYSENFGNVIAEAFSYGLPVITTNNTPWKFINNEKCGWCIDLNLQNLTMTITHALLLSKFQLYEMGLRGKNYVENNLSIHSSINQFINLYNS